MPQQEKLILNKGKLMEGRTAPKSLLLAPSQPNPLCTYPPYCSSSNNTVALLKTWRRVSGTIEEVPLPAPGPDDETKLINEWVEQQIRIGLGGALLQNEPLPIDLPANVINTIKAALHRRTCGAPKPG
jgi:hypothetical protein